MMMMMMMMMMMKSFGVSKDLTLGNALIWTMMKIMTMDDEDFDEEEILLT